MVCIKPKKDIYPIPTQVSGKTAEKHRGHETAIANKISQQL